MIIIAIEEEADDDDDFDDEEDQSFPAPISASRSPIKVFKKGKSSEFNARDDGLIKIMD